MNARQQPFGWASDMTFEEHFKLADGRVERTLVAGPRTFTSSIDDTSKLRKTAPLWSHWWRSYLRGSKPVPAVPLTGALSAVDLFCGCGGLSLGVREAARALGMELTVKAAVDVDRDGLLVYEHNIKPEQTIVGDVSILSSFLVRGEGREAIFAYPPEIVDIRLKPLVGKTDLVIAGPPCQGHSNFNNHTRRDDPRNALLLEAIATAIALDSKAVIIENVPDVIRDAKGVVDTAMGLLHHAGYSIESGVLSAHSLGLPQTRRRFFLLASKTGVLPLAQIGSGLGKREGSTVRWAIEDLLKVADDADLDAIDVSPETRARIDWLFANKKYDLPDHLRPDCHKNGHTYNAVYGRLKWNEPANTVTTGFLSMGQGRFIHPSRKRTLTPREAARLQGFPDHFEFRRSSEERPSRRALAKWIGDAVPPILGYAAAFGVLVPLLSSGDPAPAHVPTPETRTRMKAVRRSGTSAEQRASGILRSAGLRHQTNVQELPGTPDIVFPDARVVVFVHGCYWHQHSGCARATTPKSNTDFWVKKFASNRARDDRVMEELRKTHWHPMTVWECDLEDRPTSVVEAVRRLLAKGAASRRPSVARGA